MVEFGEFTLANDNGKMSAANWNAAWEAMRSAIEATCDAQAYPFNDNIPTTNVHDGDGIPASAFSECVSGLETTITNSLVDFTDESIFSDDARTFFQAMEDKTAGDTVTKTEWNSLLQYTADVINAFNDYIYS
ncbi:MAG: hypothetical protein IJ588_08815 [Prevotella sp.]|nr:hypothetical protein [Prevotella sp.]